ncbi:hypothetical protein KBZ21_40915, partial [Streptomyces sp. A73]|nr:hypothetical protein [Streptomyces sp. A73]
FGGIVDRPGRILFAMPPRRPAGERERWVRVLLAHREGYSRDVVNGCRHEWSPLVPLFTVVACRVFATRWACG